MLIRNIYTHQVFVNGTMGVVTHVDLVDKIIYAKFDASGIGCLPHRSDIGNTVPINVIEHKKADSLGAELDL